ncbi:MAG: carbohydrate binding domain-containing protein [Armatimonadetes bacterium]|nr:carbohydrate binding domain-containing protein [Armatimonadota bacterium]
MNSDSRRLTGMRTILVLLSVLMVWSCLGVLVTSAGAVEPQLIKNGDMEQGNPPVSWEANGATLSTDTDSHSGRQSLRINPSTNLGRAAQTIPVKPGAKYRLTFWYKCSPGGGMYFYVNHNDLGKILYADAKNDDAWTRGTGEFEVPKESPPAPTVGVGFCGWPGKEVLIDDVSITEVMPGEAVSPPEDQPAKDISPAAVQKSLEDARKQATRDWRAIFPRREFVCWGKSPWEKLAKISSPPASVKECKDINLTMGVNEYESASFVLTNSSDKAVEFAVTAKNAGIPTTVRQAVWVTSFSGKQVNDALPLLEGKISIPSGESREIWLSLYSRGVKPGDYRTEVVVKAQGLPSVSVNLKVKVYPVSLPDDKPIYTHYWDYVVPEWTGPELARALLEDLKQHYVNVPALHPWPIRLQVNPDGTLKEDYGELDSVLDCYRTLNPKMIVLSWNPDAYLEKIPGFEFFGDKWTALFRSYLTGMVSHLKEKGWDNSKFAIHPYDERLDAKVCRMAKLIKEIDPRINVVANSTGTPEDIRNIAPYVNIFMPHYSSFMYDVSAEVRNLATKLLPKSDQFFWTYTNAVPPFPQESSPYADYRLAVWRAWEANMGGFGYWIYCYKTHWNSYKHEDGENWSVVYLANAKDAPAGLSKKELVVTGKRWEATREGVEDYVYLRLLKDRLEKADGKVSPELLNEAKAILLQSPKTVLADPRNTGLAEAAKEKVLKVLSRLR